MLREACNAGDKKRQDEYMLRIYKWYFNKLSGLGGMTEEEKEEEERFINPKKFEKMEAERNAELDKRRKELEDVEAGKEETMAMFRSGQRTEIKEIPPA